MENKVKIQVENLSFKYDYDYVLQDISFKIYDKDLITIIGPNGGGKSTLLKLLLGILKPQIGEITINGQNIKKLDKRILGYVPQYKLFDPKFPITVFDIVLSERMTNFSFKYSAADKAIAHKYIDEIGLANVKYHTFAELSGGQRQRVLIARALCCEPEILLMDEPTTNIDSTTEDYLSLLIRKLNQKLTIILVTHDTAFTTSFKSRVFCIGKHFHEHPTQEIDIGGDKVRMVRHDLEVPHVK